MLRRDRRPKRGACFGRDQMRFFARVDGGQLFIHVVATCSGYKIVEDVVRPGQPNAWVCDLELKNLNPHEYAR